MFLLVWGATGTGVQIYQLSIQQPPNTIMRNLQGPYINCLALLSLNFSCHACPLFHYPHLSLVHMNRWTFSSLTQNIDVFLQDCTYNHLLVNMLLKSGLLHVLICQACSVVSFAWVNNSDIYLYYIFYVQVIRVRTLCSFFLQLNSLRCSYFLKLFYSHTYSFFLNLTQMSMPLSQIHSFIFWGYLLQT